MSSARELTARLLDLLRCEQGAMADFLIALADFDRRRLWVELGYTSLFHFLNRELGMSKGAAHYRKTAAELIQRVPEVVEALRDGRLCITSIIELAKVVTPENQPDVLPRFFHCSRQEAKAVSAELCPAEAAPHRTVVTTVTAAMLGAPRAAAVVHTMAGELPLAGEGTDLSVTARSTRALGPVARVQPVELRGTETPPASLAAVQPGAPRTTVEPLTADLRRLHTTVSKRFLAKLNAARDALSHSHPGADIETILEVGLDLVIERHAKRKGIVAKPRKASAPLSTPAGEDQGDGDRHIPAHVKREVWTRDQGRCQWRLASGETCGSTGRVQFDHIEPVARGGKSTVSNMRLLCFHHNQVAARHVFGDAFMDRFTAASPAAISVSR
jgi:hypothetical protein